MTDSRSPARDTRRISVVDAVCCVYFCAAGKSRLLVAILAGLGLEILVPEEVEREILGKRCYGQLSVHWARLRASEYVQVLPRLLLDDERSDVVAVVARVRGMSVRLALATRRDLGEAVVIGHARCLADQGDEVYVLVDDQVGQALAFQEGIDVMTVEDLLLAAVALDLLPPDELRATYEALRPFGSGLPGWQASSLRQEYVRWQRTRTGR